MDLGTETTGEKGGGVKNRNLVPQKKSRHDCPKEEEKQSSFPLEENGV